MRPVKSGRPADEVQTELGKFIQRHLNLRHLTHTDLARHLGMTSATLKRIMNGDLSLMMLDIDELAVFLELSEAYRRQLFTLVDQSQPRSESQIDFVPQTMAETGEPDLEVVDWAMQGWATALSQGYDPTRVADNMQRLAYWLSAFTNEEVPPIATMHRLIFCQALLATSQNLFLAQEEQRFDTLIPLYTGIATKIQSHPQRTKFAGIHQRTLIRRAILFREAGSPEQCLRELQSKSAVRLVTTTADSWVQLVWQCQIAHTHAMLGQLPQWKQSLDRAQVIIDHWPGERDDREQIGYVLDYTMALGYKHLAWERRKENRGLDYAHQALQWFMHALHVPATHSAILQWQCWLVEVAPEVALASLHIDAIEALGRIDPEAALERARSVTSEVLRVYPALATRLERMEQLTFRTSPWLNCRFVRRGDQAIGAPDNACL